MEPKQGAMPPAADPELVEGFRAATTATVSDSLGRLPAAIGLRPFHAGGTMAGTALTVRTVAGDNLALHRALALVRPGDVIVVDGGGDTGRALLGEIMVAIAESRGAAGLVIDGAVRDADALRQSRMPVFARAAIHRGPFKHGPGEVNVPVSIGGLVVAPGDIVVGDGDGVVAFPQQGARALLDAVRARRQREAELLTRVRAGEYAGAYPDMPSV